jgi:hypothetical protein
MANNSPAMGNNKDTGNHLLANTALHRVNTERLRGSTALHREETMALRPANMVHLLQVNMDHQEVPIIMDRLRHLRSATSPVNSPTSTCPAPPMTSAPQ